MKTPVDRTKKPAASGAGKKSTTAEQKIHVDHETHHRQSFWTSVAFLVGCAVLVVIGLWVVPRPPVLSTVSAVTELVSIEKPNPALAAFSIYGMKGRLGDEESTECFDGVITPSENSRMTYGRVGYGPLEITIAPHDKSGGDIGTYLPNGQPDAVRLKGSLYLQWDPTTCGKTIPAELVGTGGSGAPTAEKIGPPKLPIYGYASFGDEGAAMVSPGQPKPMHLISAQLKMSARSLVSNALYDVTDLTIPVGSRIVGDGPPPPGTTSPERAAWWGAVYADPEKPSLSVEAATTSAKIYVIHPYQQNADTVEVPGWARLFYDPALVKGYIIFAVLIASTRLGFSTGQFRHGLKKSR